MALTGLHTNWLTGSYSSDREYMLRAEENTPLFTAVNAGNTSSIATFLRPHFDTATSLAIGYGLDLLVNNDATINQYLTATGLAPLTSQDATVLAQARAYRNAQRAAGQPVSATSMQNFVNQLSLDLLTDTTARGLLNVVANDHESKLIQDLTVGGMSASDLATFSGTREFAALVSLKCNGVSPVVRDQNGAYLRNTKMLNAILNDDRAEAWYEIRYNSNGNDLSGLAKRRFFEADTFGLYRAGDTATTISDENAKDVFRMYTQHRDRILAYEAQYAAQITIANNDYQLVADRVDTWAQDSQIARQYLVDNYAEGRTIDGEVLVGKDDVLPGDTLDGTASGDLLFGEKGNDVLRGEAGDDALLGGDGTDQLTGGTGNDYLDGGAGYDTYIYRINDGQDMISDADGKGSLFYDGKLVVGGQRPAGSTGVYTSLDGTFTFLESGNDLIVNNLITIKNYTPGKNGITLRDLSTLPTGTVPTINYTNGLPDDPWTLDNEDNSVGPLGGVGSSSSNVTVFASGGNDLAGVNSGNLGNAQLYGGISHDLLEVA